ncbi:MAG: alpha/beta hydrolase [Candidatus Latescibacterota bacterium]
MGRDRRRLRPRPALLGVPRTALVLSLAVAGVLVYTFVLRRGRTPELEGERSVASLETVRLGGAEQWVLIRGHDRSHPVVLFLHGGPGMPAMYLAHAWQRELERDFVVVHWDRRGAGKSYSAAAGDDPLSVSQALADTYELTQALRRRFGQEPIYLVGHSWGSYLGLLIARQHPECYAAYIGVGQLAGTRAEAEALRHRHVEHAAAQTGDEETAARLAAGGPVTEDDLFRYGAELHAARSFWPLLWTGLLAPEYTLRDVLHVKRGADEVARRMACDVLPRPLEGEVTRLEVPVFLFLGRHDYTTPSELAAAYAERLQAPFKEVTWFEHSAHFSFFEEPARFHTEMLRVVRAVHLLRAEVPGR